MPHPAKPAEGSWTEHYPDLGTGPVSYADSVSPGFYEREREAIFARLPDYAQIGVGQASVEEIEQINILRAAQLAMRRAVDSLGVTPALIIVDGNRLPGFSFPTQCVVGGDGISLSIAAASIVAKVTRDREMKTLAESFPGYGWETNVGYPTPEHRAAIQRLGLTPHHRRTFRAVYEVLTTNYCFDFLS